MKKFACGARSPVIGIGGGVCLDVIGLAASLFRRKSPYVRVPTTALSCVSASIGAKSGVNFMGSKNRLGAYVPPVAALLDRAFLATEEPRAVASGVSEMMKMALMKSPRLFELLEAHAGRLVATRFQGDDAVPGSAPALHRDDARGSRRICGSSLDRLVDFGHAFGQELEMHALGTDVELTHGEAVNVDMAYMTVLAHRWASSSATGLRILRALDAFGCPIWHDMMTPDFVEHAPRALPAAMASGCRSAARHMSVFNGVPSATAPRARRQGCLAGSAALADSGRRSSPRRPRSPSRAEL
ncbi:shikimate 3-dehydrogenase [Aureococcus anophagefferens]|nr:shikimate 3-dehydrogenase [Aureococcus anophagefferens]